MFCQLESNLVLNLRDLASETHTRQKVLWFQHYRGEGVYRRGSMKESEKEGERGREGEEGGGGRRERQREREPFLISNV